MCEASWPSILGLMMMVDWKFWRRGQIDHKAKALLRVLFIINGRRVSQLNCPPSKGGCPNGF